MPYEYKGDRAEIEPTDELPTNLQHQPVYALPYEHFDGPFKGSTDARYISVGLAQWNPGEVSLKIFRRPRDGSKWTRQSEELPLHRAVDAVLFAAKVVLDRDSDDGSVTLPAGTLEGQKADLVSTREEVSTMAGNFDRYLDKDVETEGRLKERFKALYETLKKLHMDGKF